MGGWKNRVGIAGGADKNIIQSGGNVKWNDAINEPNTFFNKFSNENLTKIDTSSGKPTNNYLTESFESFQKILDIELFDKTNNNASSSGHKKENFIDINKLKKFLINDGKKRKGVGYFNLKQSNTGTNVVYTNNGNNSQISIPIHLKEKELLLQTKFNDDDANSPLVYIYYPGLDTKSTVNKILFPIECN